MKKFILYIGLLFTTNLFAQTGIGTTTPHASAKLDVTSTDKGFLPPRMTSSQRTAIISPASGLMVYQTDGTSGLYYYNGSSWIYIINSTTNVLSVVNGGTGTTTSTGTGSVVLSNSPTLETPTISSGNGQFPNSIFINPTSNVTSKRAALWTDEWGLLQDFNGDGTKNFSITQKASGSYPSRFFINTAGAIGIGTTSPQSSLHVKGGYLMAEYSSPVYFNLNHSGASLNNKIIRIGNDNGSMIFDHVNDAYTTSTERMRIDPNGKVGIGTASPSTNLHIANGNIFGSNPDATTSPSIYLYNNNNASTSAHSTLAIRTNGNGGGNPYVSFDVNGVMGYSMGIDNADADKFKIHTNWSLNNSVTPALTITSTGNIGIGTPNPNRKLHVQTADATSIYVESTAIDNNGLISLNANTDQNWNVDWHEFIEFKKQGARVGYINWNPNSSSINYSSISDYRLKMDLKNYSGLNLVNKIKTYDFAWKSNNLRMYGVMAHELQDVLPYAVSGMKDAIDKEGKIIPQAVDYGKLTPILIKAVQEQDVKIKELQLQIDTLLKRLELIESKK